MIQGSRVLPAAQPYRFERLLEQLFGRLLGDSGVATPLIHGRET